MGRFLTITGVWVCLPLGSVVLEEVEILFPPSASVSSTLRGAVRKERSPLGPHRAGQSFSPQAWKLFAARVPGREGGPREKNEKDVHVFEDCPPSVSPLLVSLPRARLPLCSSVVGGLEARPWRRKWKLLRWLHLPAMLGAQMEGDSS